MNDSASVVATTRPFRRTCIGTAAVTATDPASMDFSTGAVTAGTASVLPAEAADPFATPVVAAGEVAGAAATGGGAGVDSHDARGIAADAGSVAAATGSDTTGGRSRARSHNAAGTASISTSAVSTAIAIRAC